jgi:hypothetical protein
MVLDIGKIEVLMIEVKATLPILDFGTKIQKMGCMLI